MPFLRLLKMNLDLRKVVKMRTENETLESQHAAMTERAERAEADFRLTINALERACPEDGIDREDRNGPFTCVWCGDADGEHDKECAWLRARQALSEPAILAEVERVKALETDRARLGAMMANKWRIGFMTINNERLYRIWMPYSNDAVDTVFSNPREAIDAAIHYINKDSE